MNLSLRGDQIITLAFVFAGFRALFRLRQTLVRGRGAQSNLNSNKSESRSFQSPAIKVVFALFVLAPLLVGLTIGIVDTIAIPTWGNAAFASVFFASFAYAIGFWMSLRREPS